MAQVAVGQTLRSVTDTTTVIVVRGPAEDVEITCGGAAMVDSRTGAAAAQLPADPSFAAGTLLGKRYEDGAATIELLCTKAGPSSLAVNGELLVIKAAKPLPASD
jgi:hypothetical protein